jgi:tetratricopeptide (TPR) repeat protein
VEYYGQAQVIQRSIGDIEGQARSLDNLGILHLIMGEHETARQEIAAGLSLRQRLGDRFGIAQSEASLAELALIQGRCDEALTHAERALSLADAIESPEIQVYARWVLALAQAEQGQLDPGLALAQEALEVARTAGFVEGEVDCLRVGGMIQFRTDRCEQAETMLQNSIELAQEQNDPYRQGLALIELGRIYQAQANSDQPGRLGWRAKAVVVLNQAGELFNSLGAAYQLHQAQTALGQLQGDGPDQV